MSDSFLPRELDPTFFCFPFGLVLNIVCAPLLMELVLNVVWQIMVCAPLLVGLVLHIVGIPLQFFKTEFDWLNRLNEFLFNMFNACQKNLNIAYFVVSPIGPKLFISRIPGLSETLSLGMSIPVAVSTVFLVSASLRIGLVAFIFLGPATFCRVSLLAKLLAVTLESVPFILKVSKS